MSKSLLVQMLALVATATVSHAAPLHLYVSPSGNDTWSGGLPEPADNGADGPFATPGRALAALREAAAQEGGLPEGAAIYVREGSYYVGEPLRFDAALTGKEGAAVRLQAFPNENPRLVGGVSLPRPEPGDDGVLRFDLSTLSLPAGRVPEVYVGGVPQVPARWPNAGEGDLPGGGFTFVKAAVDEARNTDFIYTGDRPGTWSNTESIQVSIWPNYNWWQGIADVKAIDPRTSRVTLASELPYTIEPGRRLYFQHVREELDAPGEWYHDLEKGELLLRPSNDGDIVVPVVDTLVVLEGVQHVHVVGFTMEASRGDAVLVKDSQECTVGRNRIRSVYARGIAVEGGANVRVLGNDIEQTGGGGIYVDGGDRTTLEAGNHQVKNNHIHHFARIQKTYHTGVQVGGVGNVIANNLIHDAPHIAILLGGNDHVIEFNHIHHVCQESGDNGAFYMGRDWTQRGVIIRNNIFEDVYGFGLANPGATDGMYHYDSPHQAWGVYLDDCSSGVTVYGNLFNRVPLCGVMIGGGRDNEVINNFFYNSLPALHIDDRWDSYPWELMQERLNAMNYNEPPYSERYPKLLDMGEDPRKPENNVFKRNVIAYTRDDFRGLTTTAPNPNSGVIYDFDQFDPESTQIDQNLIDSGGFPVRVAWSVYKDDNSHKTLTWEEWREKGFEPNSAIDDADFSAPEEGDFHFEEDAAAKEMGINPLPLHRVGLYQDEFRASWPPPANERRDGIDHSRVTVNLNDGES